MKILHIIGYIGHGKMGKRNRLQNFISKSMHTHFVCTTPELGVMHSLGHTKDEVGSNWQIHEIWSGKFINLHGGYYISWLLLRVELWQIAAAFHADIINIHNADSISSAAVDVARFMRVPVIFELHGLAVTSISNPEHAEYLRARTSDIEYALIKRADKIIVQTEVMNQSVQKYYHISNQKIVVFPNVVDCSVFDPHRYDGARQTLRQRWCIPDSEVIFLYTGHLNWYNGIPQLLCAVNMLPSSSRARLVIFGDGELSTLVKTMSHDHPERIMYFGTIDPSEMPKVYAATDCSVLPRPDCDETRDATPIKLLEAMAMGQIIICTRIAGLTRLVDEKLAIVLQPDSEEELVGALQRVIDHLPELRSLGKLARQKVLDQLSMESSIQRLDDLYSSYKLRANNGKS
jgi:glycosyltransferase involved in cell wall biosynthesis